MEYFYAVASKVASQGKSSTTIDIESLQNRLLKVCYVPATSAGLPRLLLFAAAINCTNKANKAGGMCH